ncbi:hypothetical protein ACIQAC_05305 [Streptomyces sp. NPDC088387]|uniref:hypothetical protein n=1 Tax=Streptomyces sp. NPDC088387 TaxID=3365859 RepID=UPI0037FD6E4E
MRKSMLIALASAGVGAALLTGCSSDDSADDNTAASSPAAPATTADPATPDPADDPADDPAGTGGSTSPSGSAGGGAAGLDGGWLGSSDVDQVAMIIQDGKVQLAFQSTDGKKRHACEGLLKDTEMSLQCVDKASKDRVKGTVEINSGDKIAIAWSSGKKDLLTKSGDGSVDLSQWGVPTG